LFSGAAFRSTPDRRRPKPPRPRAAASALKAVFALLLCLAPLEGGCSAPAPPRERPVVGWASYYADKLEGRVTASGEPYDPAALTAAHRTLPFGTRVRVFARKGRRAVVVRVNDRGPFVEDRIIDLSRAAAEALGIVDTGVVKVELTVLD
jgi:rare lipoprotein A